VTELRPLFEALRAAGRQIAVATSDDRAPTQKTLAGVGIGDLVDALACADDGIPVKPAPEMVLTVCRTLGVEPARAAVVGDAPADLAMGRAAGAGLVVGVLSGVGGRADLEPYADVVLGSVAELV
jgi:phosphoglycolate phosphatase